MGKAASKARAHASLSIGLKRGEASRRQIRFVSRSFSSQNACRFAVLASLYIPLHFAALLRRFALLLCFTGSLCCSRANRRCTVHSRSPIRPSRSTVQGSRPVTRSTFASPMGLKHQGRETFPHSSDRAQGKGSSRKEKLAKSSGNDKSVWNKVSSAICDSCEAEDRCWSVANS